MQKVKYYLEYSNGSPVISARSTKHRWFSPRMALATMMTQWQHWRQHGQSRPITVFDEHMLLGDGLEMPQAIHAYEKQH